MNDNKSKADDADTGNAPLPRYKVTKRPAAITDNSMVKILDSIVSGWEGSLGKRTYLFGNPDCGTSIFHNNEPRPIVCHRCGAEIDWEGEFITTIRYILNATRNTMLLQITVHSILHLCHW